METNSIAYSRHCHDLAVAFFGVHDESQNVEIEFHETKLIVTGIAYPAHHDEDSGEWTQDHFESSVIRVVGTEVDISLMLDGLGVIGVIEAKVVQVLSE